MKKLLSLAAFAFSLSSAGQLAPDYKVPVPDKVGLNHACMEGHIQQLFQSVAGTSDPASAQFTYVTGDALGNLYFAGLAAYRMDPSSTPEFPSAVPAITFGSNTENPITQTRPDGHRYFVAKYNADGNPAWVHFLSENPVGLEWDQSAQKLYLIINGSGNGISLNGTMLPLDSAYQDEERMILTFSEDGSFLSLYKNRYTHDLIMAGDKKILVYRRQFTSTYYETRFGFFENNQVVKWQNPPIGFDYIHELFYNPHDNSLWFLNNSKDKYYRLFLSASDTLIFENIPRNLHKEIGFPIQNVKTIDKFHFLPGGGYVGEYYTKYDIWGYSPMKALKLARVDGSGNVVWRTEFAPQNGMWHKALVDGNGDVWVDLPTTFYYDTCRAVTAGKTYVINPWGNVGIVNNYLLKLDGSTGDIKNAYINGYGNVNYSMEITYYTNMQLLYIAAGNKLITTPQMGGVAYYPDAAGNFVPYFTSCSNQLLPSQFMWVSFDLNNLMSYKFQTQEEDSPTDQAFNYEGSFLVYPNPSVNEFNVFTDKAETFELYDLNGRVLDRFFVNENETYAYSHRLPKGIYVLRGINHAFIKKVVVQ